MPDTGARRPETAAEVAVMLLAGASGAVDAIAFTTLGHVFAGVMTGNLALLGLAVGGDHPADVVPPVVALAGFVAGTAAAARICRGAGSAVGPRWPPRTVLCLGGEAVVLLAVATVRALAGPPSGAVRDVLLCAAAVAMGGQSGAMLGAGPAARPSTYLTGTLATFVTRGVGRVPGGDPPADRWVPARLAALALGAGTAAALLRYAGGGAAFFLPPALVLTALLVARDPDGGAAGRPGGDRAADSTRRTGRRA